MSSGMARVSTRSRLHDATATRGGGYPRRAQHPRGADHDRDHRRPEQRASSHALARACEAAEQQREQAGEHAHGEDRSDAEPNEIRDALTCRECEGREHAVEVRAAGDAVQQSDPERRTMAVRVRGPIDLEMLARANKTPHADDDDRQPDHALAPRTDEVERDQTPEREQQQADQPHAARVPEAPHEAHACA